jgi:glycosyltransferase involved in cell wall biosynthesis
MDRGAVVTATPGEAGDPMHVVHVISDVARAGGGTSSFVADLAREQARVAGDRITILCGRRGDDDTVPIDAAVRVVDAGRPPRLDATLARLAARERIDVVHVHGLWEPAIHAVCGAVRALSIPQVTSPHGMLEPGALALKRWKKRAALLLYQRRDLVGADCLHATAAEEAGNLRRLGLRQPIIVVPPGLDLPADPPAPAADSVPRVALFCSRITPKKNVLGLVGVWAEVRPAGWRLVIAGPDDGGHADAVRAAVERAGVAGEVTVLGPQYGADKERLFREAALFVLPSFSENFGIVILEALGHALPVITTTGTPWRELVHAGAGWWVDPDAASLRGALCEAVARPAAELRAMGERGRAIAREGYGWSGVTARMRAAYVWATGRGPKPECVIV